MLSSHLPHLSVASPPPPIVRPLSSAHLTASHRLMLGESIFPGRSCCILAPDTFPAVYNFQTSYIFLVLFPFIKIPFPQSQHLLFTLWRGLFGDVVLQSSLIQRILLSYLETRCSDAQCLLPRKIQKTI